MHLSEALRSLIQNPGSAQARARVAAALDELGVPAASAAWLGAVRAAAARGQFFLALTLARRSLTGARQREALGELARRFGAGRPRSGRRAPPPLVPPREVDVPADPEAQVALALRLAADLDGVGLPADVEVPAVPLFGELPEGPFVALAGSLEAVPLAPGDVLVAQGTTDRAVFLLAQGAVRVTRRRPDGQEAPLAEVSAPALVGEMALLTAVPRRATVTACEPGLAWRIDGAAVEALGQAHAGLTDRVRALIERRLLDNLTRDGRLFGDGPQRDALLGAFRPVAVPAGAEVIARGAPAPGLFVVLHGEAEVWTATEAGEPVRVATLAEGDVFGERSLITGQPTTAAVRLPDGGVLLHLPVEAWRAVRGFVPGLEAELAALADVRHGELAALVRPVEDHFEVVEDAWLIPA
jgi:CRP-like cAMP-binding protein